jgi:hypothetical protein
MSGEIPTRWTSFISERVDGVRTSRAAHNTADRADENRKQRGSRRSSARRCAGSHSKMRSYFMTGYSSNREMKDMARSIPASEA